MPFDHPSVDKGVLKDQCSIVWANRLNAWGGLRSCITPSPQPEAETGRRDD